MERRISYDKYNTQKQHAKRRGIEWQFTYDTWMAFWGDDIEQRGSKKGQLVMARYNDEGPYHPDNCRKLTTEENTLEARKNGRGFFQPHSEESKAKIRAYKFTDEHRAKISLGLIGNKNGVGGPGNKTNHPKKVISA